VAKLTKIA